jgi:hypothetical protein
MADIQTSGTECRLDDKVAAVEAELARLDAVIPLVCAPSRAGTGLTRPWSASPSLRRRDQSGLVLVVKK